MAACVVRICYWCSYVVSSDLPPRDHRLRPAPPLFGGGGQLVSLGVETVGALPHFPGNGAGHRALPDPHFRGFLLSRLYRRADIADRGRAFGLRRRRQPAVAESRFHQHPAIGRSEEHTSELQSLMRNSYAVFCMKKKNTSKTTRDELPNAVTKVNKMEDTQTL